MRLEELRKMADNERNAAIYILDRMSDLPDGMTSAAHSQFVDAILKAALLEVTILQLKAGEY